MEDEPLIELEENGNVQIKGNRNPEQMKRKWKKILKNCMHKDFFGNQIV
jgi:hypothetical protein